MATPGRQCAVRADNHHKTVCCGDPTPFPRVTGPCVLPDPHSPRGMNLTLNAGAHEVAAMPRPGLRVELDTSTFTTFGPACTSA